MKIRMLGFLIVLTGLCLIGYGISFLSVAEGSDPVCAETIDAELKTGKYYINANSERACIEIFDDFTFQLTGYERQDYIFREWKDMAVTDEKTGDIKLVDLYFLGTNLDGAENYTEKIRFIPENNTLEYNGDYYFYID